MYQFSKGTKISNLIEAEFLNRKKKNYEELYLIQIRQNGLGRRAIGTEKLKERKESQVRGTTAKQNQPPV